MKNLDFLIIGAQKSATTTLFELLRQHPSITMPLEKEVPFFIEEARDAEAWEAFAKQHFPSKKIGLWGKASPQYLCDPTAAAHIKRLMPDTKLIAILRDPIDRSRSHYKMDKRRELEHRSIDDAVAPLLSTSSSLYARSRPVPRHRGGYESESDFFIAWSEYGAALAPYYDLFPRQQILVLYTEELERDPAGVIDRIMDYLDLPLGFRPSQLGKVMHKGGGRNRIAHATRVKFRRTFLFRLWQRLSPTLQGRIRFLYDRWNSQAADPDEDRPSALTEAAMRRHFAADLALLLALGVPTPPWSGRYLS